MGGFKSLKLRFSLYFSIHVIVDADVYEYKQWTRGGYIKWTVAAGGQSRGVACVTMLPLKPVIAVLALVTVATASKLETLGRLHLLPLARRMARKTYDFSGINHWLLFCIRKGFPALSISQDTFRTV